jgi:DNA-binding transcriptional ArsR family regulator
MPRTYGLSPAAAARLFHALGHATRVRLLLLLAERGETSVGDLQVTMRLTQTNASNHLGVLRHARLVESRRDGKRNLYRLASPVAADVLRLVRSPPRPAATYGLSPGHAARFFDALAHEARVGGLLLLAERGEASVGDLQAAVGLTPMAVNHHLGVLRRAGVAECRRDGKRNLYRLASPAAADVLRLVCGGRRLTGPRP